jgi:diguanylate cyclase (GGDEF)-like protein
MNMSVYPLHLDRLSSAVSKTTRTGGGELPPIERPSGESSGAGSISDPDGIAPAQLDIAAADGPYSRAGRPSGRPAVFLLCGGFVAVAGSLVLLIGWLGNVTVVKEMVPGTVAMKASTSLMFVLCGAALVLIPGGGARRRFGQACAAFSLLLALAFLSEYVLGWNLGIDEFPFRDTAGHAARIAFPGRLAPTTAVCFVLVSVSLLLLRMRWRIEEALMVPVLAVATLCLIGYVYTIPVFYGPASAAKMALNTGILFLIIAGGIVFARPRGRLQAILDTTDPGAVMARRLLPIAVLTPLVLGGLDLVGQDAGAFGSRVGIWLLTATTIACLAAVITGASLSLSGADRNRLRLEGELQRLAGEDDLTKLANRRRFQEQLRRELKLAAREGTPGALLMLDLDVFKTVNDQHGHAAGDALLCCVADALRARLRESDLIGRLGGDEFVAYLPRTRAAAANRIAGELLTAIADASAELGEAMRTTASVGVTVDSTLALDPAAMLRAADSAMYRAKRGGGDRVARCEEPSVAHAV